MTDEEPRKIAIIGTTSYQVKMQRHALDLKTDNPATKIRLPIFDRMEGYTPLSMMEKNRENIEWADEIHLFWDQRSLGTILDLGMTFALRKRLRIIHLENEFTLRAITEAYAFMNEARPKSKVFSCPDCGRQTPNKDKTHCGICRNYLCPKCADAHIDYHAKYPY